MGLASGGGQAIAKTAGEIRRLRGKFGNEEEGCKWRKMQQMVLEEETRIGRL